MKRSREVAEQNSKGVEFLFKKHKIDGDQGHRHAAARAGKVKVRRGDVELTAKKAVVHRDRLAREGPPADRPRAQQDDGDLSPTRRCSSRGAPQVDRDRRRRRRRAASSPTSSTPSAPRSRCIEALPRILPVEDAEASDAVAKALQEARHRRARGRQGHQGRRRQGEGRRDAQLEVGGKTRRVDGREGAGGRRARASNTENIGLKEAGVQLTDRGFIKVDRDAGDHGAGRLRHRRRGRPADARAQGQPRGRRRRRAIAGQHAAPDRLRQRPERDLLPPRGRERRPDRGAVQGAGSSSTRSAGSPSAPTAAPAPSGETEGFVKIIRGQEVRRDPRRAHRRRATPPS